MLTAEQLVRRLLWLIPPARLHLTSFHGLFSSHAKARASVMPKTAPAPARAALAGSDVSAPAKVKRPRLDWATLHARTFGEAKDLLEGLVVYLSARQAYFEQLNAAHFARAQLLYVTGETGVE